MSTETNASFNRAMREVAERHRAARARRAELERQLRDADGELAELEADVERECAWYVERFDRDGDGRVTPVEVLKTIFSDAWHSWTQQPHAEHPHHEQEHEKNAAFFFE